MKNLLLNKDLMMKTKAYIIASLVSVALFTACEKSDIPDRVKAAEGARICFINLSADVTTTGAVKTNELNLYFGDERVTVQRSLITNRLRGIPYRSTYPGAVTAAPTTSTVPTSYQGAEYFIATPGTFHIVAKDTVTKSAVQDTLFETDFTFVKDKYYTVFSAGLMPAMVPVIVEDNITEFITKGKVKVRVINALYGVTGGAGLTTDSVDIWMIHQAATTELGKAPYILASNLDSKTVTAFTDTISSGSYKWAATIAGTVPTAITAPTPDPVTGSLLGKSYTITFPAGKTVIAAAAAGTSFTQKSTYSLVVFGQFGKTSVIAPAGGLFRNRVN